MTDQVTADQLIEELCEERKGMSYDETYVMIVRLVNTIKRNSFCATPGCSRVSVDKEDYDALMRYLGLDRG